MDRPSYLDRSPLACRLLAVGLILTAAVLRLVYLGWFSPLNLAPDEAHYWDWSRHLDWSYYSKGPLVALLIRFSCEIFGSLSVMLTGSEMLAVRFPAVVCGSLLLVALYLLTTQIFGREKWGLYVVMVALTMPMVAAGSSLMTIDAPFTCLWTWALVAGWHAVSRDSLAAWLATGAFIALGILAKHTMVLWLPCFGLFLLFTPAFRPLLWRRNFWFMAFVALSGAVPIIWWNAYHGWVTIRHTEGHAGLNREKFLHPLGPLVYLGTQFALLLGFWFVCWAAAMIRFFPVRDLRSETRYLWWMSAPIVVFFGLFSLKNGGGEPNWPIAGYLAGMVLSVAWLIEQAQSSRYWYRVWTVGSTIAIGIVGVLLTIVVHDPVRCQPLFAALSGPATTERPMPLRRMDPTCRLRGWTTLAKQVDAVREQQKNNGVQPLLAATSWSLPGEIGFYCEGHPAVYSIGPIIGDRHSQYDLWHPNPLADPETFKGQSFIIVGANDGILSPAFDKVEPTRLVEHREGDHLIAVWTITVAHGFRGFPTKAKGDGY